MPTLRAGGGDPADRDLAGRHLAMAVAGLRRLHEVRQADAGSASVSVASLTGAYRDIGEDMRDGFLLYLDLNDGRLGGHDVDIIVVDEADGGAESLAMAVMSVQRADIAAVTGATTSQTASALLAALRSRGVALVGSNGLPELDEVSFAWSTSFRVTGARAGARQLPARRGRRSGVGHGGGQPGRPGRPGWLRRCIRRRRWRAGESAGRTDPDAERDELSSPPGTGQGEWRRAIYAHYVGADAISFVQQYAQSDARDLPLFGVGSLTEGAVLAAQGRAALGIRTVLNYAPDLDNPVNRRFVDAWRPGTTASRPPTRWPRGMRRTCWTRRSRRRDRSRVRRRSTRPSVRSGLIDSPRGEWQFSSRHSPVQKWYLRQVRNDGRTMSNSLIQDLDILGAEDGTP